MKTKGEILLMNLQSRLSKGFVDWTLGAFLGASFAAKYFALVMDRYFSAEKDFSLI